MSNLRRTVIFKIHLLVFSHDNEFHKKMLVTTAVIACNSALAERHQENPASLLL
jgi:hypothetical protein